MEYDQYKWSMSTSRFFLYIEYMNKAHDEMNKSKHQRKADKLKNTLTRDELKELYDNK